MERGSTSQEQNYYKLYIYIYQNVNCQLIYDVNLPITVSGMFMPHVRGLSAWEAKWKSDFLVKKDSGAYCVPLPMHSLFVLLFAQSHNKVIPFHPK